MSVINDDYLYSDYCASPTRPEISAPRARELANRVGVPPNVDICTGLSQRLCRVQQDACPDSSTYDTIGTTCGTQRTCISAGKLIEKWKTDHDDYARYSPRDRIIVKQTLKKRGTPKARAKLTCAERRGNTMLCDENPLCKTVTKGYEFLGQTADCVPKQPLCSRFILLDAILRTLDEDPSGNMKRRIEQNIKILKTDAVCAAIEGFYPSKRFPVDATNQLNTLASSILGKSDTLDTEALQSIANSAGIEVLPKTAILLTTAFNAASAALAVNAPWWLYFTAYPSGRDALRDILSDSASGQVFKLSLIMTGVKGNWIFEDQKGLLDSINLFNSHPIIGSLASTLTGVLLRQLSSKLKSKLPA